MKENQERDQAIARAEELDRLISDQIADEEAVVEKRLILASHLAEMKKTKGYRLLGIKSWTAYLTSKNAPFSRAYMFLLAKIGGTNMDWLRKSVSLGLSPSVN